MHKKIYNLFNVNNLKFLSMHFGYISLKDDVHVKNLMSDSIS